MIPLSERFNSEKEDIRYSRKRGDAPIFVSNAQRAVEGIKQEKATGEQWLAMLKKNGGLKAEEDKWIGLSDFLKDKKSVKPAGFIESWGQGIDKIRTEIQSAGLPEPMFEETCGGMMVTINRGKTFSDIISDKQLALNNVLNKLSERQRIIYDRLKKTGIPCVLNDGPNKLHIVKYINEIETAKSIALFIGVSERTVRRYLVVLQKEKLDIHTGTLNKGQWEISSFE